MDVALFFLYQVVSLLRAQKAQLRRAGRAWTRVAVSIRATLTTDATISVQYVMMKINNSFFLPYKN
jgi:hypothetical protein